MTEVRLTVVAAGGLVTIQDAGRPGHMHEGVPPGGALVPELLARANAAAGNDGATAAAVEVVGSLSVAAGNAPVLVGSDAGERRTLAPGEAYTLASGRARVVYLGVRGGIDVPSRLGARSTLLVAGFGGHEGRPLRRGDVLPIGNLPPRSVPLPVGPDLHGPIRIVPGPDLDRFRPVALETLLGGEFRISPRSDRVGLRLTGPALERADADGDVSAPMVRGAIQVPQSGEPVVLGPDHPTTGGYPVLATVVRADLGALMGRPAGSAVHFVLA